jgi:large subunit ribosomal protein L25
MKKVSMSGSLRAGVGKKDAKLNRAEGKVPCVMYGGKEELHFTVDEKAFGPVVFSPHTRIIKLDINGKEHDTILQEVQYHPVTDEILHADFLELQPGKPVIVSVPLRIEGNSPGVLRGGKLVKKFRKLKLKAIATDLPDEVIVNISNLDINDAIKVEDIKIDKVQLLDLPGSIVVTVISTRAVEPAAEGGKK